LPAVLLVVHEEKDERDLLPIAVVKPARGTAIRFLGSASVRPLRVVRLRFALPDVRDHLYRWSALSTLR
jgi:hypothetical protein